MVNTPRLMGAADEVLHSSRKHFLSLKTTSTPVPEDQRHPAGILRECHGRPCESPTQGLSSSEMAPESTVDGEKDVMSYASRVVHTAPQPEWNS